MKKEHKRNTYWQKKEDRQSIGKKEQDKPLNNKASKQTLIFRPFKGLSTVHGRCAPHTIHEQGAMD